MKIILTQEVRNIGAPGDVVDVADGYARNYLIPRGVALRATKGTLKQVDTIRRTREVREIRSLEQAQEVAQRLGAMKIRIQAKAGEGGRLFGQVTPAQIAEAIAKGGGPKIDKKRLHLEEPVKSLGAHRAHLRLHPEVEAEIEIEVQRA
jgi:large subunit ribosomal protein L9